LEKRIDVVDLVELFAYVLERTEHYLSELIRIAPANIDASTAVFVTKRYLSKWNFLYQAYY
jgi:hypothetical protein